VHSQRGLDLGKARVGDPIDFGSGQGTITKIDRRINTAARGLHAALLPAAGVGVTVAASRLAVRAARVAADPVTRLFLGPVSVREAGKILLTDRIASGFRMRTAAIAIGAAAGTLALGAYLAANRKVDVEAMKPFARR
jgi:hypothetical protein